VPAVTGDAAAAAPAQLRPLLEALRGWK
jgi:hypothetical protein